MTPIIIIGEPRCGTTAGFPWLTGHDGAAVDDAGIAAAQAYYAPRNDRLRALLGTRFGITDVPAWLNIR